ncbi:polyhydroxyalkanoate synthesis repressor PhaR [Magnetospira sp. QH-2]|uniref:polyhydroxyalkanoate synthesis repressor PhaR n=1 Tax=Magnetospira sp. (strain QH-2) TaxID=1288970 RepID=UPI0003E81894|nr:polyhydroxyalkanoate synthesis repressor PhaR [Magnetospira sp. QH-2]CCQ74832.1 putative polyhydroxyalkanoate synthesis repressor PhaR-like protein [Magnetospira sp. QH-2]
MAKDPGAMKPPFTIKKYANRRLYNTATSSYVTLDHLAQMVKDGTEFVVYDAKSGDDITRSVLTQIIVEEENKGQNLLPIGFLRHLISFYGDSLQGLVPRYLEHSMQAFARNQEQMRHYMQDSLNGLFPFGQFEEMNKQNMVLFENAMRMFAPFADEDGKAEDGKSEDGSGEPNGPKTEAGTESQPLNLVQSQLQEMQKQLDALAKVATGGTDDTKDK